MSDFENLVKQLEAPKTSERRAAAKKLKKARNPDAGPALMEALRVELEDRRTWETQVEMVLAIGYSRWSEGLPFLRQLLRQVDTEAMIGLALGYSIILLEDGESNGIAAVLELMNSGMWGVGNGALRAMAILRLQPDTATAAEIIKRASSYPLDDTRRLWVAAAAAGWDCPGREAFLNACLSSSNEEISRAGEMSLKKKYIKATDL